MKISDVMVLSSNYEGFGLVLLEAMIVSCPIIAANNSAIPEVLGSGYSGLFETGNVLALTNKLIEFQHLEKRELALKELSLRINHFRSDVMEMKTSNCYPNGESK
jgi:CDP-glycerol glycerophosphotransferase